MLKLLVVEDQKILLDGISYTLSKNEDIEIAGKLTDASKIGEFVQSHSVDVILTDVCTENGNNSLDYIGDVKKKNPEIKIVVMTGLPEISFLERAKQAGANSFVYKNISTDELANVIKSTGYGYNTFPADKNKDHHFKDLSEQELLIIRLYCEGYERKEIADRLFLSENTIRTYIANILFKTDFSSMARLAIYAVANNIIMPGADKDD